jgi:hypothetical protein
MCLLLIINHLGFSIDIILSATSETSGCEKPVILNKKDFKNLYLKKGTAYILFLFTF